MSQAAPTVPATRRGSGAARAASLSPLPEQVTSVSSSSSTMQEEQNASAASAASATNTENTKHKKRRSFFGLGKKKPVDDAAGPSAAPSAASGDADAPRDTANRKPMTITTPTLSLSKPTPTKLSATAQARDDAVAQKPTSPVQADSVSMMSASITSSGFGSGTAAGGSGFGSYYVVPPASPGRSFTALSSSPRMSSPAGSQIFERDVQHSGSVVMAPNSPAIPTHFTTENYIPPVLDASSEAITDDHLDPDTVEIITHAHHQLAMQTVAGVGGAGSSAASVAAPVGDGGSFGAWLDEATTSGFGGSWNKDDGASNYGSIDPTDVRRLSFISFADVVQAEHQQQQQQQQLQQMASSGSLAGLASLAATATATAGAAAASPPTSKSGSVKGLDFSPVRPLASPTKSPSLAPSLAPLGVNVGAASGGGELAVETMAQALRRTGSGDLGGFRSTPQSPV